MRARESADQHLPILALTASALPDEAERCAQAGMDALLVKPAGMADLRDALYRWMPATAAGKHPGTTPAPALSPLDALSELFGPSARLGDLIDGFLSNAHADMTEFDQAVRAKNAPAIAGHIHRINGAIKIFGATALADEGEQLRAAMLGGGQLDGLAAPLGEYRQEFSRLVDTVRLHRQRLDAAPESAPR